MFTDIVGYTSLMGKDEQKAFSILNSNRELQRPIIERFNGRWIKELGDGVMASFNTISDAVSAAIDIQIGCNHLNTFQLRIGIHLGEVIFDDNDVFGDGVNIAARIQSVAMPGTIFISEPVQQNLLNKHEIKTRFIKESVLKNVSIPVRIYEVLTPFSELNEGLHSNTSKESATSNSLIVLPFINMSNDPDQEFFSDGLTEDLITKLTGLKAVQVVSRTTSMLYKGSKKSMGAIAKETGVHYVIEGSVRKQAANLRITAQLIDAEQDIHMWAETYSGTIDDIFDIQEQVSTKIVEALRLHISKDEIEKLNKRHTSNTAAYQFYLRGLSLWKKRNETSLKAAARQFEKALEEDSEYALAWAGLADTYSLMGEYTNNSRRQLYPMQKYAIEKALEIDDQLGEAHISLGISLMYNEWNWKQAEKEFKSGIALSPSYATGHHWYAQWLLFTGNQEAGFEGINKALELDPVSQGIIKDKGLHYYYSRQYEHAAETALMILEFDSDFTPAHRLLSLAYEGSGQYDKAVEQNEIWGKQTGNKQKTLIALAQIYAAAGRTAEALSIVEPISTKGIIGSNDHRGIALVYTALADFNSSFAWLEKSYEKREESLCSIKIDPKLDAIRHHKKFDILLKKVGLDI